MPTSAFLRRITSIAAILPSPVYATVALLEGRRALQSGPLDRAVDFSKKGIGALESTALKADVQNPACCVNAMKAALWAIQAMALKRLGRDGAEANESYQTATAALSSVLEADPLSAVPFSQDYVLMLAEFGASERALQLDEDLRKAAVAHPQETGGETQSWLRRAVLLPPDGRLILALGSSQPVQDNPNAAFQTLLLAAGVALVDNDKQVASEATEKALEILPGDVRGLRIRGLLRWRFDDFQGAKECFEAVVDADPSDRDARVALAHACLKLDDPEAALRQLSAVLSEPCDHSSPVSTADHSDAHWLHGVAGLKIGVKLTAGHVAGAESKFEAAIQDFTEALELNPRHAACLRSRAQAYFRLSRLESALKDADDSLRWDPDDVNGHGWRAEILLSLQKYDDATAAANVALAMLHGRPTDRDYSREALKKTAGWLYGLRGRALLKKNWPDQAIAPLSKSVDWDPGKEETADALLDAYEAKQGWAELAEKARKLQDGGAYPSEFVAKLREREVRALRESDRYADAFSAIHRDPVPEHPNITWLRARLFADVGDFESARDSLPEPSDATVGAINHWMLRGWIMQNIEPRDLEERSKFAAECRRLYASALRLAVDDTNSQSRIVWIRKGLANALLRLGLNTAAFNEYEKVIQECGRMPANSAEDSALMLYLTGWCYFCRGEYSHARYYYGAAQKTGKLIAGTELDFALLEWAGAVRDKAATGIQSYEKAVTRVRDSERDTLRRIGMFRIALHDVRELQFRNAEMTQSADVTTFLTKQLRQEINRGNHAPAAVIDHVNAFLEVVETVPPSQGSKAVSANAM